MDYQLMNKVKMKRGYFIKTESAETDDVFALVAKGSFRFTTRGGTFTVNESEGALFRKGEFYHREVLSPADIYFFRYKSKKPLFDSSKIVFKDTGRIQSTIQMLDVLESEVFENEHELRSSLFSDIVTQYRIENRFLSAAADSVDEKIDEVITGIKQSLHKKIDMKQCARKADLSYPQFIRRFKKYTGMTPTGYVTGLKLNKAKELLLNTDLSVTDVAFSCGFDDAFYFSNFFKKHMTVSPAKYRNNNV